MAGKPEPSDPTLSEEPVALADYCPVTGQRPRHDGWTAEWERPFSTGVAAEIASGPQHSPSPHPAKAAPQRLDVDERGGT